MSWNKFVYVITCAHDHSLPRIHRILNIVLIQLGIYPKEWKKRYINPIFKAGERLDPSNYRGITIMNCLGKLFNSVLKNRLDEYLSENNSISETQIGFKKKARTSDHMFVLRTLIEKYTKQSTSRLVTCFIDLKKKHLIPFYIKVSFLKCKMLK